MLLQYVDALPIAAETEGDCSKWTVSPLNFLRLNDYRVSQQKTQMTQHQVTYLGLEISRG